MRLAVTAILTLAAALAEAAPPLPETPAPVQALVSARPFVLDEDLRISWYRGLEATRHGYLLVIAVDPELVYPRQSAEPVLYVEGRMAPRANVGYLSGHVVAFVPGELDLEKARVWFGTPELPERVGSETGRLELERAQAAGVRPIGADAARRALERGGPLLELRDFAALGSHMAGLVREHAPEDLVDLEGR